ncbi:MAG: hypothetical protein NC388_04685 [Clostridium sp.]|nr:hypothetical protein [Clostridium sp.]
MASPLFLYLFIATDSLQVNSPDTLRTDTLREVTVNAQTNRLPVKDALDKSLGTPQPRTLSLGEILNKYAPELQDKMLHPFAIKQRKKERHKKKMRQVLKHYDEVKSFEDLVKEALMRQELENEQKAKADNAR